VPTANYGAGSCRMRATDRLGGPTSGEEPRNPITARAERQTAGMASGPSGVLGQLTGAPADSSVVAAAERRGTLAWWALGVVLASRLFVMVVGYLARSNLHVLRPHAMILAPPSDLYRGPIGFLLNGWANMDGGWYLSIAHHGYAHRYSEAFFPLYPMLVRLLAGASVGYVPAAIALSLVCFVAAAMLLFRLTADALGGRVAFWTVVFLSIAPTSFFFQAVYTESLFLLLSVALFFFAERRQWLAAGLMGLLATLTRSAGVVLVVPLALFYLQACDWQWRRLRAGLLAVLLVPCGLAIYMAYLWRARGDPLLFSQVEKRWHRHYAAPYLTVWQGLRAGVLGMTRLFTHDRLLMPSTYFARFHNVAGLTNAIVLVVVAAVIVLGWRRLGTPYNAYAALALVFVLTNPDTGQPLASLPRYSVVMFPLYMAVAACTQRRPIIRALIVSLCLVGLVILTARFVLFAWVA
jgi:Mannosyltransferase (PIG-V)